MNGDLEKMSLLSKCLVCLYVLSTPMMMHFWSALRTAVVVAYRTGYRLKINRRVRLLHLRFRTVPRAQEVRSRTRRRVHALQPVTPQSGYVPWLHAVSGGGDFSIFLRGLHRLYRNRWFYRVWRRNVCACRKNSTGCCYKPFNDLYLPIFFLQICSYETANCVVADDVKTCVASDMYSIFSTLGNSFPSRQQKSKPGVFHRCEF